MKTLFFLLLTIILSFTIKTRAAWEPFGIEGITANKVSFLLDNNGLMGICHDAGIMFYDNNSGTWTDYSTDLPVIDAYYLNGEDIIVIMGCGTDSDGIYSFDPENGEYAIIEYLECPWFISHDDIIQQYYVGHHLGLATSSDGINWTPVDVLEGMNMVALDIAQNHLVVSQLDNIFSTWHSDDHGNSWTQTPGGTPMISDLCFDHNQKLYGIFPDESWSSGLWSSTDYGYTWEVEFWSVNLSCVGIDAMGDVFTGWDYNPSGGDEGIARYDPDGGGLTFINEGLSSLVINDICINPAMSALALFCCTDSGAFISYDYVEVTENPAIAGKETIKIFPNPASKYVHVAYSVSEDLAQTRCQIFQVDGKKVDEIELSEQEGILELKLEKFHPGIYLVEIGTPGNYSMQKLIIF